MEPSSGSAAAGLTITVGTVSVVGTLLGMHYDALLFGLFGGLIFLSQGNTVRRTQAVTSVIASALLAGVGAPILSSLLVSFYSALANVDTDTMRRASALLIGGSWQAAIPYAFKSFKETLSKWQPKE